MYFFPLPQNAILIVEFARELERRGRSTVEAAVEASRLRLRPILMTSFAFIMGVVPLAVSQGAGAEMRQAIGIAVFWGMLGVTFFGLVLTPVFYVAVRRLGAAREAGARFIPPGLSKSAASRDLQEAGGRNATRLNPSPPRRPATSERLQSRPEGSSNSEQNPPNSCAEPRGSLDQ